MHLVIHGLNNSTRTSLVKPIQRTHILGIKVKTKHVRIRLDASRIVTLGQGNPLLLKTKSDENLAWGDTVFLGNAQERLVVGLGVSHEGAVCLNNDAVLLTIVDNLLLL